MSFWSEFYAGDRDAIERHLEVGDSTALRSISFSGGLSQPFLSPTDLDLLIAACDRDRGTTFGHFFQVMGELVWGDPDTGRVDGQAYILKHEALAALAAMSERALDEAAQAIHAQQREEMARIEKRQRAWNWEQRIKNELAFHAILLALSLGVQGSQFPLAARVLVPALSFGLFWGLRLWMFGKRRRRPLPSTDDYNWRPRLGELHDFLALALERKEMVVYRWSL